MAITENREGIYKYKELDRDSLYGKMSEFLEVVKIYIDTLPDIRMSDLSCNFVSLSEMIVRIDKRKDYFSIFHDNTSMNEVKEVSLMTYWVIKFRPFSFKDYSVNINCPYINELVAAFLLLSIIKSETLQKKRIVFPVSSEYVSKLLYALRFWDLSKESIMLIGETLCELVR